MIDPVMTLYNHVKRNPLHLPKSLATIAKHRAAGRFDPDLALRLLRNNVTDNVRAMPNDRFTIAHVSAVAVMLLVESGKVVQSRPRATFAPAIGGFNPVVYFKGERHQWAGVYESAAIAQNVAVQLLNSANRCGFVS